MNKELEVLKLLAELGIDVTPKEQNSPDIEKIKARLKDYEKELGEKLDPEKLAQYLG